MTARTAAKQSETARDVLISVNPRAGLRSRHDRVAAIERAISAAGYRVRLVADLEELSVLSQVGAQEGRLRAVLTAGGDGTAAVVRNHVPLEVPILPLPLGTESLLGRYTDQSAEPAAVVATLDRGVVAGFDLGRAGDRYFLLMISVGFDAEVIRRLHNSRRGNISRLAYVKPTLSTIRSYRYPELQLYCNGSAAEGQPIRCRWLFGFNLPKYACGWQIAPDAVGTDGLLDVCAFHNGSLLGVFRYLWHVTCRAHHLLADMTVLRSECFRLEAAGAEDVAYQIDGEFGGTLPVDVEVLPGELRLLVSVATATRLGFTHLAEAESLISAAGN
ncbi:MAG: hypothetical protein L0Z07_03285 [Planctomycetes bacterium]|nr:hypothetical protein [Planctomycetota bacterium]